MSLRIKVINKNRSPSKNSGAPLNQKSFTTWKSFFKTASEIIIDKSQTSFGKVYDKLNQTAVSVPPNIKNKKSFSKFKAASQEQKDQVLSQSRGILSEAEQTHLSTTLSDTQNLRLRQIAKRKLELLQRLRKIDQQLHNPSNSNVIDIMEKSKVEKGNSYDIRASNFRESPSKSRNQMTYDSSKHNQAIEMLSRINQQKLKRQQKLVTQLKKKQQIQIQKVIDIEKDQQDKLQSKKLKNLQASQMSQKMPKINKYNSILNKDADLLWKAEENQNQNYQYQSIEKDGNDNS